MTAIGAMAFTPDEIRLESERRLALSTVAIILIVNLAIMMLDLSSAGPGLSGIPPVVVLRLVGVLIAAVLTAILSGVRTQRGLEIAIFIAALATVALLVLIRAASSPSIARTLAFDLVYIPTIFVALPTRPALQLIPVALLGVAAGIRLFDPALQIPASDRFYFSIVYISAVALGYLATSRRHELRRDLSDAQNAELHAAREAERAQRELQTLRGIIPICSHCHRVRIEDGRLWEAVDMYVSRITDAAFSHGVCPDCLVEHYPNVRHEPPPVSGSHKL